MENRETEKNVLKVAQESVQFTSEDASITGITSLDKTEAAEVELIHEEVKHMGKFDPTKTLKTSAPTKIDVKNTDFWYGSKKALLDVSIPLLDGQVTALIGPSGCGK